MLHGDIAAVLPLLPPRGSVGQDLQEERGHRGEAEEVGRVQGETGETL